MMFLQHLRQLGSLSSDYFYFGVLSSENVARFSIDVTNFVLFQLQLSQPLTAKQLKRLQSCELGAG